MIVLAVDPGRAKCGIAVVDSEEGILFRSVVPRSGVTADICELISRYSPANIVVGRGTGSSPLIEELEKRVGDRIFLLVDEEFTTLDARTRYFQENPPRGLRKLIPRGLLTPKCCIDDYVAVILAERFLQESEN